MKRLLLIFLLLPWVLKGQIITTWAGTGQMGNTGDGGLCTSAKINYPCGGMFDKWGNYYMAMGASGNTIRKIDTGGIITTIGGTTGWSGFSGDGGLAVSAELNNPQAVCVDTSGNIYIADAGNNRIRKIDVNTGIITTVAGIGTAGYSGDGGLATAAQIFNPLDVCTDRFGNLYIADVANNRVRKVDALGNISTFAGNGNTGYSADGGLADTSAIGGPTGLCSDDTGNIYIGADARYYKVNLNGIISTIAGNGNCAYNGDGGLATAAEVCSYKITWDKSGNFYICDDINYIRVRKINSQGIISHVTGNGIAAYSGDGGPADSAQMKYPAGVCTDKCGNLYIADAHDFRIRKVTYDSTCSYSNPVDTTTIVQRIKHRDRIDISPNPTQNELTITAGSNIKELAIISAMGQTVLSKKVNGMKQTVQTSGLSVGVYFVVVWDERGEVWRGRFVKE